MNIVLTYVYHLFVYIFVNTHIVALGLIQTKTLLLIFLLSYVSVVLLYTCMSFIMLSIEEEIKESITSQRSGELYKVSKVSHRYGTTKIWRALQSF